jgi:hypothetical protein
MAINPETRYAGKIAPSSSDYPYGSARNIASPGDGTGTPWEAALVNDIFGFQQALLSLADVTPSGNPDKVGASQYLDALLATFQSKVLDFTALQGVAYAVQPNVLLWELHPDTPESGGAFFYDATINRTTADGGIIVDTTVSLANQGTGSGLGCWVRNYTGPIFADWFGKDSTAVTMAAAAAGYVHLGSAFTLTSVTIDVPLSFAHGAYITAVAGQIITITNRVDSPRQFIFQGDATYYLAHDYDSGEDSREVHASWFGAFPSPSHGADQAPMINKAFAAMGNARESIVHFDIGNYNISSQIQVTRGGWVKGAGTRRTVFKLDTDGFDVFTTSGQACKFSEIQFELHTSILSNRTSPYIVISQNDCVIKDVVLSIGYQGIVVNANGTIIDDVACLNSGSQQGAGSSLIEINGSNTNVRNIKSISSAYGCEAVINVGGSATTAISGNSISNIQSITPSKCVFLNGNYNIFQTRIDGVTYTGYAGAHPDNMIHIKSNSSANIESVIISNIVGTNYASGCILVESAGSGYIQNISINSVEFSNATNGITLKETSGTIKDIYVSSGVDVSDCTNPLVKVGSPTDIKISPHAIYPNANETISFDASVPDNTVFTVNLYRDVYAGSVILNAGFTNYGIYSIRAAGSPGNILMTGSTNMAAGTGTPTGYTGTDGKITLFTNAGGMLYVENRSGSTQGVSLTVNTGRSI